MILLGDLILFSSRNAVIDNVSETNKVRVRQEILIYLPKLCMLKRVKICDFKSA